VREIIKGVPMTLTNLSAVVSIVAVFVAATVFIMTEQRKASDKPTKREVSWGSYQEMRGEIIRKFAVLEANQANILDKVKEVNIDFKDYRKQHAELHRR
jgi:hypothetical protein